MAPWFLRGLRSDGVIRKFRKSASGLMLNDRVSYQNGLAQIEKDGKLMYIDHSGAVVWEEK